MFMSCPDIGRRFPPMSHSLRELPMKWTCPPHRAEKKGQTGRAGARFRHPAQLWLIPEPDKAT